MAFGENSRFGTHYLRRDPEGPGGAVHSSRADDAHEALLDAAKQADWNTSEVVLWVQDLMLPEQWEAGCVR